MKWFLFILAFILLPLSVEATTYYVGQGTGDSDANSCTTARTDAAGSRKRNIMGTNGGLACLQVSGDILDIRGGAYSDSISNGAQTLINGTSVAPMMVRGHVGETVSISRLDFSTGTNFSYWHFDNLTIDAQSVQNSECFYMGGTVSRLMLSNSIIQNCGSHGIHMAPNSSFLTVTNVEIKQVGVNPYVGSHGGGYCMYIESSDNTFNKLNCHNAAGYGIHLYTDSLSGINRNTIKNSIIHNNGGFESTQFGLLLSGGDNNQAFNNLIYSNTSGVQIDYNCTNCKIYNNTIYNNTVEGFAQINIGSGANTTSVKNNIFYTVSGNQGASIADIGVNTIKNNNHCKSAETGCITTGDPRFVNESINDFHLQATSPAINQGTALGAPYDVDFDGVARPQGTGWDVGAFEFQAVYWTRPTGTMSGCTPSVTAPTTDAGYKSTIAAGIGCLTAGSTLNIRAGTYNERLNEVSGTVTFPRATSWANATIIQAYPGETVTIRPTAVSGFALVDTQLTSTDYYLIFKGTNRNFIFDAVNVTSGQSGIKLQAPHIRLQSLEIKNAQSCSLNCAAGGNSSSGVLAAADFLEILDSDIHTNGSTLDPGGGGYSVYFHGSNGLVEGNLLHDNVGMGIQVYAGAPAPHDDIVRGNAIYGNGCGTSQQSGGMVVSGANHQVYNNLFYSNCGQGIADYFFSSNTGTVILNNTSYGNTGHGIEIGQNAAFRNNISVNNGGGNLVCLNSSGTPASCTPPANGGTQSNNLCFGTGGTTGCSATGDPLFVNAGAANFHLQTGSAAVNQGFDVSSVVTIDYDLQTRTLPFDIGAYKLASEIVPPTTPELVARYGFNEVSGSTVLDSSGKNNHGTFGANVTRVTPGKYGKGLQLTGGYITVPNATSLNLTDGMTVAVWLQPTAATAWHSVLTKGSYNYFLYSRTGTDGSCITGEINAGFSTSATLSNLCGPALTLNVWTHVALTYNKANSRLRLYINGVLTREVVYNVNMLTNTNDLLIGNSLFGEVFTGYIDELWVYNFEKTGAEVATIMNTPVDVAISPPSYALGPTGSKKIAPGAPIKTGHIIAP